MTGKVSEKNTFVSEGRLIRRSKLRSKTKNSKIKRTKSRRQAHSKNKTKEQAQKQKSWFPKKETSFKLRCKNSLLRRDEAAP